MTQPPIQPDPRALDVFVTEDMLLVGLADGRELSIPLGWSERLAAASPAERDAFRISEAGDAIEWPGLGETLSVASLLRVA